MIENQNVNKKDEKIQSGYEQLENFDKENNDNNNYEEIKEENNEELNKENPFNQVQKSIIEQRNIIQSQLKFICNKIEDALNTYHIKKLEKEREKEENTEIKTENKTEEKTEIKTEEKTEIKSEEKTEIKSEEKPEIKKLENTPENQEKSKKKIYIINLLKKLSKTIIGKCIFTIKII